jgi:heptosyltransferase-3
MRGGAIGDFVLTLPVLAALRRHFPQAEIEVLGYPRIAALALAGGLADQVYSIEAPALCRYFVRDQELDAKGADYFARFDTIISYLYDPEGIVRANISRCSTAQFIVGTHRPDEKAQRHATDILLDPLKELGIQDADPVPRLFIPPTREAPLPEGSWLAVHPGSGSERKNWPEQHWSQLLLRMAADSGFNFLLVGGEAEGERVHRFAALLPEHRTLVASNWELPDLARTLAGCAGYLGHDSGISHLAAAVGLPGLVLWGETNESLWRPRSDRFSVLRDPEGLNRLPVARVIAALAVLAQLKAKSPGSPGFGANGHSIIPLDPSGRARRPRG